MNVRTALALGRVSNLPTVWSDVLAGAALSSGTLHAAPLAIAAAGASLLYVGGMFLNDAFDRAIDARERPERPIPSRQATAREVFVAGFGLLAAGIGVLGGAGLLAPVSAPWNAAGVGAALAGLIVLYDAWHQTNPLAPFLMGLCRALLYVAGASVAGGFDPSLGPFTLWSGAAAVLAYVAGLTLVAARETWASFGAAYWPFLLLFLPLFLPPPATIAAALLTVAHAAWVAWCLSYLTRRRGPRIPLAVTGLIAGVSLLDARLSAGAGRLELAGLAVTCWASTLVLQRRVRGT